MEKYYPRFGFQKAAKNLEGALNVNDLEFIKSTFPDVRFPKNGLKSQWDGVPDEAFMVLILNESTMKDVSGVVRYRDEFNQLM